MDTLALVSASIPAYFVFIPLSIIVIILIVLIIKSGKDTPVQTTPPVVMTPAGAPGVPVVQAAPSVGVPSSPVAVPPQSSSTVVTSAPTPSVPAIPQAKEGVVQADQIMSRPTPTPPNVPPVSSWKPVPQATIPENARVSESQMQAHAMAEEKVVHVDVPATPKPQPVPEPKVVVDVIAEPVVTPSAPPSSVAEVVQVAEAVQVSEVAQVAEAETVNQQEVPVQVTSTTSVPQEELAATPEPLPTEPIKA